MNALCVNNDILLIYLKAVISLYKMHDVMVNYVNYYRLNKAYKRHSNESSSGEIPCLHAYPPQSITKIQYYFTININKADR